jgi:valyl-tRNA synthetase
MVRDQFGKKMSKSFGTAVNPLDWMNEFGSDAVRFTLARGANPGVDVPIGVDWVQGSRNFCNKVWNATRFALMNGATLEGPLPAADQLSATDRWILSRLGAVVSEVDALYDDYQFAKLSDSLYHFAWDEVFDWYVELSKATLIAGGPQADATRRVLGEVLETTLRLLHPVIPFVTETLWTALTGRESVVIADWPVADASRHDRAAEEEITALQQVVTEIRRFRADQGLNPGQKVPATLDLSGTELGTHEAALRSVAKLKQAGEGFYATTTLTVAGAVVGLDLSGAIDVPAERKRLAKDLLAAEKELMQTQAKLANEAFLAKAAPTAVEKIHARRAKAEADIIRISGQLKSMPAS